MIICDWPAERDREKERTVLGRSSFGKERGRKEVVGSGDGVISGVIINVISKRHRDFARGRSNGQLQALVYGRIQMYRSPRWTATWTLILKSYLLCHLPISVQSHDSPLISLLCKLHPSIHSLTSPPPFFFFSKKNKNYFSRSPITLYI